MAKKALNLLPYLVILIMGFLLFKGCQNHPGKEYWQKTGFKTHVIVKKEYVSSIPNNTTEIPPETQVEYKEKPKYVKPDTIYVDSGRIRLVFTDKEIPIDLTFLAYRPETSKLLEGKFNRDGFSLDLMDTSGKVRTLVYPTNYDLYAYYFDGTGVRVGDYKKIDNILRRQSLIQTSSNAYLTYEVFTKAPYLSVDYSVSVKKLGIYGMGSLGYLPSKQNADIRLNLGLRYRLK